MVLELKYTGLAHATCEPCEKGTPPLSAGELESFRNDPDFNWEIVDNRKIVKEFKFDSYAKTIAFVNKVAYLAEDEGHHPVLHVHFRKVGVELWTHAIDGLSDNDFIMAAKIDEIHV